MSADADNQPLFFTANQLNPVDHHCLRGKAPAVFQTEGRSGPELLVYRHDPDAHLREVYLQTGARKFNMVSLAVPRHSSPSLSAFLNTVSLDGARMAATPGMPTFTTAAQSLLDGTSHNAPAKRTFLSVPGTADLLSFENVARFEAGQTRLSPEERAEEEARLRHAGLTPYHKAFSVTNAASSTFSAHSEQGSSTASTLASSDSIRYDLDRMAAYRNPLLQPDSDTASPMALSPQYTLASPMSISSTPVASSPPANGLPTIPPPSTGPEPSVNYATAHFLARAASAPPARINPLPELPVVIPSASITPQATSPTRGDALVPPTTVTTPRPTPSQPETSAQQPNNPFAALLGHHRHANTCCLFCRDVLGEIDQRTDNTHRLLVCLSELTRAGTAYTEELQQQAISALDRLEDGQEDVRALTNWIAQTILRVLTMDVRDSFEELTRDVETSTRDLRDSIGGIQTTLKEMGEQAAQERREIITLVRQLAGAIESTTSTSEKTSRSIQQTAVEAESAVRQLRDQALGERQEMLELVERLVGVFEEELRGKVEA